jgi:hypothetical protein
LQIVESNQTTFALDQKLSPQAKDEIVIRSIEKLLERDSPQLETMKMQVRPISYTHGRMIIISVMYCLMQVEFDTSFWNEDSKFQKTLRLRNKILSSHRMGIIELDMAHATDFEALTLLYRKIFQFLIDFNPSSSARSQDKTAEREVAAALESVFPRVGLKSFVQLSTEDKSSQLMELARIVLGIRIFNRSQGRGGQDIENIDEHCEILSREFSKNLDEQIEKMSAICDEHQQVIVRAHLIKKRQDREAKENAPGSKHEHKSVHGAMMASFVVTNELLNRWSQELANRRQYLSFLKTLQNENKQIEVRVAELRGGIRSDLTLLANLISGKSSVPKEDVYPRFQSLTGNWLLYWEAFNILKARIATYQTLVKFQSSFNPTVSGNILASEREFGITPSNAKSKGVTHTLVDADDRTTTKFSRAGDQPSSVAVAEAVAESKQSPRQSVISPGAKGFSPNEVSSPFTPFSDMKEGPLYEESIATEPIHVAMQEIHLDDKSSSGAVLLSPKDNPDLLSLPLELQGFCPWSIVVGKGLLVPGRPALGIVRFENLCYVFDHLVGIKEFMQDPEKYLTAVREMALRHPEFIHLLNLQGNWFPTASISRLLDGRGGEQTIDLTDMTGKPLKKDAGTGTPTHFVERHIDLNYHWNEWELRKRALKTVNLMNCKTTAQQTDHSHFRRENETQVYLPTEHGTQTKRDSGTNPPTKTSYIAGLRGRPPAVDPKTGALAVSKYVKEGEKVDKRTKSTVVTLTLDL